MRTQSDPDPQHCIIPGTWYIKKIVKVYLYSRGAVVRADNMSAVVMGRLAVNPGAAVPPKGKTVMLEPVFRIHDILVWIRIRILLFSSLTFKMPAKNRIF
jgi:hypothetical protein